SLDMLAADLMARFSANGVDPTLVQGDAGLFTANLAADMPGLAQSLQINPRVDPAAGGSLALLRDGIGAETSGPVGNPAQILRLHQALVAADGTGRSMADHASALLSDIATRRLEAEADDSFTTARLSGLATSAAAQGVDSDQELQQLLLVEQAFSANARVLQVADDMIGTILGI
ncbi:MAG: flagellar basal body rod C-terminal domain-containing protein, partial [Gemmobacter sp.]